MIPKLWYMHAEVCNSIQKKNVFTWTCLPNYLTFSTILPWDTVKKCFFCVIADISVSSKSEEQIEGVKAKGF